MADNKKRFFDDLLMNNKFVFIISLVAAVALWAIVSMTIGDDETRIVENVKVVIEDSGTTLYQAFGFGDTYVDVTVKGKKYLVSSGALSANDITVTAKLNYVDAAGIQKLKLSASIDKSSEIKITSISKSSIEVFFDIPKTETLPVETVLEANGNIVPQGYIYENPILPISTVKVKGPATEINKIEKFVAVVKIDEELTSTAEIPVELEPVVKNDGEVKFLTYETDIEGLSVTVPVSKVKEIPLSVRYINMPSYYEENMPEVNIYPKTLKVAAAQSVLDSLETLNVGTVGFDELTNKNNKFTFDLENIDEVKIIDDVKEVSVVINCYPMKQKTMSVSAENVTLLNTPKGKTASLLTESIDGVCVVGMNSELKDIDSERLFAKVDLSEADDGTENYEAVLYIKDSTKCWVYGKYTVSVKIE